MGHILFRKHVILNRLISIFFSIIIAVFYYKYNKVFVPGFIESSGNKNEISFKRSYIENFEINEEHAKLVCFIIQKIIETKNKRS